MRERCRLLHPSRICCRHLCNGKCKESTVAGYTNTLTNTVVEWDCGSVGTTDHKGNSPTRFVRTHM
ncbi:hypothetical protein Plhal304r1_c032g0103481 [Plasmopara halstedii]